MKQFPALLLLLTFSLATCKNDKANEDPAPSSISLTNATTATDTRGNVHTVGFDQATSINQELFCAQIQRTGARTMAIGV